MTKKLSPSQLKKNAAAKARKRAAQAKADQKLTAQLAKREKALQKRLNSLSNSKARGKTLAKQSDSIARQAVELIEERRAHNRKDFKKSIIDTILGATPQFIGDFFNNSGALTGDGETPLFSATHSVKRERLNYEKITTIQICPSFAPMRGADIGVTERGKIVEQALLEAQKLIDQFTDRKDTVGCDFPISSSINYEDGHSTLHFAFIDHKARGAAKYYIDNLSKMGDDSKTANTEIVFPINLHILQYKKD